MKKNKMDREEFRQLLEKFSSFIRARVLKYGIEKRGIDPEDIIQEVKIKIWKKYADEKEISFCSSYINRVVNSTLIDHLRRIRRQENLILHERQKLLLGKKGITENPGGRNTSLELLSDAADSLMESRRKVVKLFLLDLSIDEISLTLRWTKGKTRNLLYRGLSDLKRKLKEKGVDYED